MNIWRINLNSLKKTFFISFGLFLCFAATAGESDGKNATETKQEKKKLYTREMVVANIKTMHGILNKGNENGEIPVKANQIKGFVRSFDFFASYPEIEKVTGMKRDWFTEVKKVLSLMYKPKVKMDTAILNKDKEVYSSAAVDYNKALKKFNYLMKHPKSAEKKKR